MEESVLLHRLESRTPGHKVQAIEELTGLVKSSGKLHFNNKLSLFSSFKRILQDDDLILRTRCTKLICDIIPKLGSDMDTCMSFVMPNILTNMAANNLILKRESIKLVKHFSEISRDTNGLIRCIIWEGIDSRDLIVSKEVILNLNKLILSIIKTEDCYNIIAAICKRYYLEDNKKLRKAIRESFGNITSIIGHPKMEEIITQLPTAAISSGKELLQSYSQIERPKLSSYKSVSKLEADSAISVEMKLWDLIPESTLTRLHGDNVVDQLKAISELEDAIRHVTNPSEYVICIDEICDAIIKVIPINNFRVFKASTMLVSTFVDVFRDVMGDTLCPLTRVLCHKIGDNKIAVREGTMKCLTQLMKMCGPKPVLDIVLLNFRDRNPRVREEAINVVIKAMLTFPIQELNVTALMEYLASMLADSKPRVVNAGLEAIAVLSENLPPNKIGLIYRSIEKIDYQDRRYLNVVKNRLERGTVSTLNDAGLVTHGEGCFSRNGSSMGSTSRISISVPTTSQERTMSKDATVCPPTPLSLPRRYFSAGRNRLPWERASRQNTLIQGPEEQFNRPNSDRNHVFIKGGGARTDGGSYAQMHLKKMQKEEDQQVGNGTNSPRSNTLGSMKKYFPSVKGSPDPKKSWPSMKTKDDEVLSNGSAPVKSNSFSNDARGYGVQNSSMYESYRVHSGESSGVGTLTNNTPNGSATQQLTRVPTSFSPSSTLNDSGIFEEHSFVNARHKSRKRHTPIIPKPGDTSHINPPHFDVSYSTTFDAVMSPRHTLHTLTTVKTDNLESVLQPLRASYDVSKRVDVTLKRSNDHNRKTDRRLSKQKSKKSMKSQKSQQEPHSVLEETFVSSLLIDWDVTKTGRSKTMVISKPKPLMVRRPSVIEHCKVTCPNSHETAEAIIRKASAKYDKKRLKCAKPVRSMSKSFTKSKQRITKSSDSSSKNEPYERSPRTKTPDSQKADSRDNVIPCITRAKNPEPTENYECSLPDITPPNNAEEKKLKRKTKSASSYLPTLELKRLESETARETKTDRKHRDEEQSPQTKEHNRLKARQDILLDEEMKREEERLELARRDKIRMEELSKEERRRELIRLEIQRQEQQRLEEIADQERREEEVRREYNHIGNGYVELTSQNLAKKKLKQAAEESRKPRPKLVKARTRTESLCEPSENVDIDVVGKGLSSGHVDNPKEPNKEQEKKRSIQDKPPLRAPSGVYGQRVHPSRSPDDINGSLSDDEDDESDNSDIRDGHPVGSGLSAATRMRFEKKRAQYVERQSAEQVRRTVQNHDETPVGGNGQQHYPGMNGTSILDQEYPPGGYREPPAAHREPPSPRINRHQQEQHSPRVQQRKYPTPRLPRGKPVSAPIESRAVDSTDASVKRSPSKSSVRASSIKVGDLHSGDTSDSNMLEDEKYAVPLNNPEHSFTESLKNIKLSSEEWNHKVEALHVLRRISRHHPEIFQSDLMSVIRCTCAEVPNLRSQVSRLAVQVVGDYFVNLRTIMDTDIDRTVECLLAKTAEMNQFIRNDTIETLGKVVDNATPTRVLSALMAGGASHKNGAVRSVTSACMKDVATKLGVSRVLNSKDLAPKFLSALERFCRDGNQETRYWGKVMLLWCMENPNLDTLCNKHLPATAARNVRDMCDKLQSKGVGSLPASSDRTSGRYRSQPVSRAQSNLSATYPGNRSRKQSQESLNATMPSDQNIAHPSPRVSRRSGPRRDLREAPDRMPASVYSNLNSSHWQDRYSGIAELLEVCMKQPQDVRQCIVRISDAFTPRLKDPNSKVNLYALQCLLRMLPHLDSSLDLVLTPLIEHLVPNLASQRANIVTLTSQILDGFRVHVDNAQLMCEYCRIVRTQNNPRIKPIILDKISDMVKSVYESRPKLIEQITIPIVMENYESLGGNSGGANSMGGYVGRLTKLLHGCMGNKLLSEVSRIKPGTLNTIREYVMSNT